MLSVWIQCVRVLRPSGKLCINAPLMPIPQNRVRQDTRMLKDIAGDIGQTILRETDLRFFEQFIWQKQTSVGMLGTYPYRQQSFVQHDRIHHCLRQTIGRTARALRARPA